MSAVDAIVQRLHELPPGKQQAVLELVIRLQAAPISSGNPREVMDQIRRDIKCRYGTLDVVLPLLREDRET